ncbi:hypothetical protein [Streptomyces sp. NPDC056949]|uniref:hypothetical protein n=1 Tax=Streptomyces sp. NPDC056949 TaxID=3345976 RepID=UPI003628F757
MWLLAERLPTWWKTSRTGGNPSAELEAECAAFEVPGHTVGIPDDEAMIRIPARMVHLIREACDAAERADDR